MTEEDLKRFSVSNNIYLQVVSPLFRSGKVQNLDGLMEVLKKLTSSLWTKSGIPDGFSGAVAGNFQELLDGYRTAVIYKQNVQFGSIGGVGGDTVRTVVEGKHTFQETTQAKTTASGVREIQEHIAKAAWQLTGAGGEKPGDRTRTVIEVVVQDSDYVDKDYGQLGGLSADQWKTIIADALHKGYKDKSAEQLYYAADRVVITTQGFRFLFMLMNSTGPVYMGGGVPSPSEGSLFSGGKFQTHWQWLADRVRALQLSGQYNYLNIQKYGVGSGKPGVPDVLLFQS